MAIKGVNYTCRTDYSSQNTNQLQVHKLRARIDIDAK